LLKQLTKRVVARALEAELTAPLGYAPPARLSGASHHSCNGKGKKTVHMATGGLDKEVPRDRPGRCEPPRGKKRQRRLEGCDAKVWALSVRGLATRDMQAHLEELYGGKGSPTLIATITDAGLDEGHPWQALPLASVSPILYFDALLVQARPAGPVQTQAVSLALGIPLEGAQARLGWGRRESEGATFGFSVCTARKNRGGTACFSACVAGLPGLPEAIEAVLPKPQGQLCSVHKVRNRLRSVPWKARQAGAADWRAL
jgi:putative transposase